MGNFLKKFNTFLISTFYQLGLIIGTYPSYFIIIPLFISAILATGFQNVVYQTDPEYLFSPTNGGSQLERKVIESNFKMNYTADFNPSRLTRTGRYIRIIITAKDGESLLRTKVWSEIMHLNELMHVINITETVQGETDKVHRYEDLCAWDSENCYENKFLDLQELMPEIQNKTFDLSYPFMINMNTFDTYAFPFIFGGMEVSERDTIDSVAAIHMVYWLRADIQEDKRAIKWEQAVLDRIEVEEDTFESIFISRYGSITLGAEMENGSNAAKPFVAMTVLLMILFACTSVMSGDCVRTKPWLGFAGVISAGLALFAAFGLLMYLGCEFIGINMMIAFLMLGIGIDDTFVMLAAWRRTKLQDTVPDRMAEAYADAAVSITITSITDMISFYIGVITPIRSVQIFCLYAGTAVLMTFLWHITFFGGCMAVAGYVEKKNKHGISFSTIKSVSEAKEDGSSGCYLAFCAGGISEVDLYNPKDNKDHKLMAFFRDYLAKLLNIPAIKALVLMMFLGYLLVACWGCSMVKEGLDLRHLARHDSYSVKFYDMTDKYFREYPFRIQVILTGDITYSDPQTKDDLIELHRQLENSTYVTGQLYTHSWISAWFDFLERNSERLNYTITNDEEFIFNLREDYLVGYNNPFIQDVTFNEDYTKIIASRFIIQTHKVMNTEDDKNMMEGLRKIAVDSRFNVTVFHPLFIFFDQYVLVRITTIQLLGIAAGIMLIISLVFIPNPSCALWVAFSIFSIEIGVVGYMSLWGVSLDSISMINLIMCIGFSVDFSAHISYAYLSAKVDTPEERLKESLYAIGWPIMQGALSTILGVSVLIMVPEYISHTFFKTVFLVTFFGAMHGIFILPVLLSLLGPGSCSKQNKTSDKQLQSPGNHLHQPFPQRLNGNPHNGVAASDPYKYDGNGTAGEESIESSPNKGTVSHIGTNTAPTNKTNGSGMGIPIAKVYNNRGYVSDDIKTEERRAKKHHTERQGEWENLHHSHYLPRSHQPSNHS